MVMTIKTKGRSHDEIRSLVRDELKAQTPAASYLWVSDMYDGSAIYTMEDAQGTSSKYSASYSISKEGKVTISDVVEVIAKQVYEAVSSFSVEMPSLDSSEFAAGSEIIKPVRLFKCGVYPDRACKEITHSDADNIIIPGCVGLKLEVEHLKKSPFSGKMGRVISATRNGDYIDGEVAFAGWMGDAFSGETPKVSIHLDAHKKPIELSMVCDPRVTEAGLMSAFNASEEKPEPVRRGSVMNLFSVIAEKLGLKESEVKEGLSSEFASANTELVSRMTALEAENLSLKQAQSTFSAATAASQASSIADTLIRNGKATPAERDGLTSLFSATLAADNGSTFSATGAVEYGPLTSAAIAREEARPSLNLITTDSVFSAIQVDSETQPVVPNTAEIFAARKVK